MEISPEVNGDFAFQATYDFDLLLDRVNQAHGEETEVYGLLLTANSLIRRQPLPSD